MLEFSKLQATGNDFVLIDCLNQKIEENLLPTLAQKLCDRHFGVGADGLLLLLPSKIANFKMRIFNADGSEAEMCGNGIRCFALYLYEHDLWRERQLEVETLAGVKRLKLYLEGRNLERVKVGMGMPILSRRDIPMKGEGDPLNETLRAGGKKWQVSCLSMGNPHCVVLVDDVDRFPVERIGPAIENHSLFPNRVNVEFVEVKGEGELKVRVWERGVGETLGCGTGACASLVATTLKGLTAGKALIHLRGGDVLVEWPDRKEVFLTGPAEEVFIGKIDIRKYLTSKGERA